MCCTLFYHCFPPSRLQQVVTRWGTLLCHPDPHLDPLPNIHTLPKPFSPKSTLSKLQYHFSYALTNFMYEVLNSFFSESDFVFLTQKGHLSDSFQLKPASDYQTTDGFSHFIPKWIVACNSNLALCIFIF